MIGLMRGIQNTGFVVHGATRTSRIAPCYRGWHLAYDQRHTDLVCYGSGDFGFGKKNRLWLEGSFDAGAIHESNVSHAVESHRLNVALGEKATKLVFVPAVEDSQVVDHMTEVNRAQIETGRI